jgi:hypothetical protein
MHKHTCAIIGCREATLLNAEPRRGWAMARFHGTQLAIHFNRALRTPSHTVSKQGEVD